MKVTEFEIEKLIAIISEDVSLRDLVLFSKMEEVDVKILQEAFNRFVRDKYGIDTTPDLIKEIWNQVNKTHGIRVV